MDWNEIQNFSSNIVFGILLFAMIIYWVNLSLFSEFFYYQKLVDLVQSLQIYYYFLFFVLVGL
jgi:hypothetical protein